MLELTNRPQRKTGKALAREILKLAAKYHKLHSEVWELHANGEQDRSVHVGVHAHQVGTNLAWYLSDAQLVNVLNEPSFVFVAGVVLQLQWHEQPGHDVPFFIVDSSDGCSGLDSTGAKIV